MKEFKFCGEMTEYVEIPVTVCETQKEMVAELVMQKESFDFSAIRMNEVEEKRINGYYNLTDGTLHKYAYREAMKEAISGTDEEMMYIIYKDGSEYWNGADEVHGKFKRYGIKRAIISTPWGYTVFGDFAINDMGDVTIEESDIEEYGVYNGQYDVKEEPEATAETVESVEETTVPETVEETAEQETEINAEIAEVEAEQTAEPETFSYEFNEIHKITISKRNNVYVEEFFEKMGGSYVKLGEKTWGCIEDIEEYYGIKINRNVQTDTEESESESESEPTADSNTVETYQGNINVLIVADVINTFEMITHTGYFDTS